MFSLFLSELEGDYVTQIPVDPSNTLEHNYRYSFLNRNNADNIHIQNRCNSVGSSTDRVYMAELGYKPEAKRKNDIINACPDNTPREYAHDRSTNRYKHRR